MSIPLSADGAPVDDAAVRQQLDRILASPGFAGSARLRRFIQYVVEQQLVGEGAQLKEYAIGVEVFDRQPHYDPRLDSIVRVEAGRLRSKLDEYYANEGHADEIRIGLPRGSYVPVFERRTAQAAGAVGLDLDSTNGEVRVEAGSRWSRRQAAIMAGAAFVLVIAMLAAWRSLAGPVTPSSVPAGISIAVLAFEDFAGSERDLRFADQLTDAVTTAIARLGKLSVVSRTSSRIFQGVRRPMHEIAQTLGADVILEAAVEHHGR
ncbi:MAG: hypothetical protein ACRD96_11780, partial [Bryobacteraceae bacterium]